MDRRFVQGFAVFVADECDVATVSPTLRGAIVNGLVRRFGVIVLDKHTDAQIAKLWERAKAQAPEVRVAIVEIGEVGEPPPETRMRSVLDHAYEPGAYDVCRRCGGEKADHDR